MSSIQDKDCSFCEEIVKQLAILNQNIEELVKIKKNTHSPTLHTSHSIKTLPPVVHKPISEPEFTAGEHPILAPMPGIVISYEKSVGDSVKAGDTVVVLEAMKMYNNLCATADGVIKELPFKAGENVKKYDTLAIIG